MQVSRYQQEIKSTQRKYYRLVSFTYYLPGTTTKKINACRGLHKLGDTSWTFTTFRVRECIGYPTGWYAERILEEPAANSPFVVGLKWIVVANVTGRHMLVFIQACSREERSQTFADLHDCFDQSFFGIKNCCRPVGARSWFGSCYVSYLTAESNITVVAILK